MASRVVGLKMKADNWSLDVSPEMDANCRDYIAAALTNLDNHHHRSRRQWSNFCVQEDETLMDDSGRPLVCPDVDRAAPPVPAGLVAHRPCLWLTIPQVASTPKEDRDPSSEGSDTMSDLPKPKRRLSSVKYEGQYGNAPGPSSVNRYSLEFLKKTPSGVIHPLWNYMELRRISR